MPAQTAILEALPIVHTVAQQFAKKPSVARVAEGLPESDYLLILHPCMDDAPKRTRASPPSLDSFVVTGSLRVAPMFLQL